MENRNFHQLYSLVTHYYQHAIQSWGVDYLKSFLELSDNNKSRMKYETKQQASYFSIMYNHGTVTQHEIRIRIPGLYTFGRNLEYDNIHKFDFAVQYSAPNTTIKELTHENIARDLYNKAQNSIENYNFLTLVLRNIYNDVDPFYETLVNPFTIANSTYIGLSIPALISNIKWISLQEDINHPYPLWGKKLNTCRYFEALYAGHNNIPFNDVLIRIRQISPRPPLWNINYPITIE